ncbi:histidine kinase [Micromonospora craterilacus]|uniref:histidine kinase n=1 Tax=Micromonospora craterilacus TaxID=1655439 RepID=A0A2W2EWV2_9ACTN|nr:histidine kinase [Micromonospora craterilacus]
MGERLRRVTRRGVRLLRADDPETGWLVRIVLSALLVWALLYLTPAGTGVRPVLAAGLACWAVFLVADRRWPRLARGGLALAALLPATVAGVPDNASALIYLYGALFTFVLLPRMPLRAILALTGGVVAVLLTGLWLAGRGPTAMLTQPALIVILVLFSLHRREYRLRAEQTALLLEQTSRTQQAQARAAALDERTRIARELHDVLAHSLGALGVQLEVAEAQLTEQGDVAGAAERIRRARRLASDGLVEARSAVAALRTDVPPLPRALGDLVAGHRADHAATVTLRTEGKPRGLPSGAEVSLLRTAREALTNAARHAPAAPVTVALDYRRAAVRLTVDNPAPDLPESRPDLVGSGPGPTGSRPGAGGHGLTGARERIALVGGTLEAGVVDGAWRVTAEVPA